MREVAKTVLGDILHENYAIAPSVAGEVTLRTPVPIAKQDALWVLDSALSQAGAALVRREGRIELVPAKEAKGAPLAPKGAPGFGLEVFALRYVAAREMQKLLEPLLPKEAALKADEGRNVLILSADGRVRQAVEEAVALFDVDWLSGMSVGLFPLHNALAKDVAQELEAIFGTGKEGPGAGLVRVLPMEGMNRILVVAPNPRFVQEAGRWVDELDRATAEGGERLWVYRVQNGRANHFAQVLGGLFGAKGGAEEIVEPEVAPGRESTRLTSLGTQEGGLGAPGGTSSFPSAATGSMGGESGLGASSSLRRGGGGGRRALGEEAQEAQRSVTAELRLGGATPVRVVADGINNALLIWAREPEYRKIERALIQLDVVPRQVLIEVNILEVNLNDALRYGVEWFFRNGQGRGQGVFPYTGEEAGAGNFFGAPGGVGVSLPGDVSGGARYAPGADQGAGGASPLTQGPWTFDFPRYFPIPGFSYWWKGEHGPRAIIHALEQETQVNMISSPHLLVTDHQEAQIQVGDEIPLQTGQINSALGGINTSTTYEYRATGVLLSVTPHINVGGLVNLNIYQEVSTPRYDPNYGAATIQRRGLESTVVALSGQTIVLGGLIQGQTREGQSKVPLLGDVPLLGNLFRSTTRGNKRTELLLLLTPQVVTSSEEAQMLTERMRLRMEGLAPALKKLDKQKEKEKGPFPEKSGGNP